MKKLTIQRTFEADRDLVWDAFTNPDKLILWWAPEGMKAHGVQVDLKIGGEFRFCFVGEDSAQYWGRGMFQEINAPEFLSYLDTFCDGEGNPVPPSYYGMPGDDIIEALIEVSLRTQDHGTEMTMVLENHYGEEMTDELKKGWHSMFDKLDRVLATP